MWTNLAKENAGIHLIPLTEQGRLARIVHLHFGVFEFEFAVSLSSSYWKNNCNRAGSVYTPKTRQISMIMCTCGGGWCPICYTQLCHWLSRETCTVYMQCCGCRGLGLRTYRFLDMFTCLISFHVSCIFWNIYFGLYFHRFKNVTLIIETVSKRTDYIKLY